MLRAHMQYGNWRRGLKSQTGMVMVLTIRWICGSFHLLNMSFDIGNSIANIRISNSHLSRPLSMGANSLMASGDWISMGWGMKATIWQTGYRIFQPVFTGSVIRSRMTILFPPSSRAAVGPSCPIPAELYLLSRATLRYLV